jgi:cytosine deaminase
LRATRLKVFRKGKLLAETPAATATLHLAGRVNGTSFMPPRTAS